MRDRLFSWFNGPLYPDTIIRVYAGGGMRAVVYHALKISHGLTRRNIFISVVIAIIIVHNDGDYFRMRENRDEILRLSGYTPEFSHPGDCGHANLHSRAEREAGAFY